MPFSAQKSGLLSRIDHGMALAHECEYFAMVAENDPELQLYLASDGLTGTLRMERIPRKSNLDLCRNSKSFIYLCKVLSDSS